MADKKVSLALDVKATMTDTATGAEMASFGVSGSYNDVPYADALDVEASLKHYTGIFGFSEDFRFGDYAGIKLGDVRLHLSGHSVHERPVGGGTAYILCDEVDDYCAKIKKNGAIVKSDPKDYPYGMRDFMAVDPDGNHLAFGCEAKNI